MLLPVGFSAWDAILNYESDVRMNDQCSIIPDGVVGNPTKRSRYVNHLGELEGHVIAYRAVVDNCDRSAERCAAFKGNDMNQVGIKPVGAQSAVNAMELAKRTARGLAANGPEQASFGGALRQALERVSGLQNEATHAAREFQMGNPQVSLEETMIAAQKASISFQAAIQVRQRLVSVYNEIMSMNV
jgi:flagellar hook-basal body complex protein FliE